MFEHSQNLQAIAEDVELAERFAVALRFHGQPERADAYDAYAEQQRESVIGGFNDEQISATQTPKARTRHPEAAAQGYAEASRRGALGRNPAAFGARPAAGN